MAKSKNRAIWYLFTTMLSIFNICTIRIFDGFNWPFYAVTVNAVISLCGLILHVHLNQRDQKRPLLIAVRILLLLNSISVFVMIGFSMFILNSQYHNPLRPDKALSSPDEMEQLLAESGKDVLLLETDDLYSYYADYHALELAAGKRPPKDDQEILMCVAAAFQATYQLDFRHENIVGWHASDGLLERGMPEKNLGAFTYVNGTARIWDTEKAEEAIRNAAASAAAMAVMSSDAIESLRSSTARHVLLILVRRCTMMTLSSHFKISAFGTRYIVTWEAGGTTPGIAVKTVSLSISSVFPGLFPTTGSYSENNRCGRSGSLNHRPTRSAAILCQPILLRG